MNKEQREEREEQVSEDWIDYNKELFIWINKE